VRLEPHRLNPLVGQLRSLMSALDATDRQLQRIAILGFSDELGFNDKEAVWRDIPTSVRPSSPEEIDNTALALGRAEAIREHLLHNRHLAGLPTTIDAEIGGSGLKAGAENRRVEIMMFVVSERGAP
jgi:hypothetical protein